MTLSSKTIKCWEINHYRIIYLYNQGGLQSCSAIRKDAGETLEHSHDQLSC